MWTRNLLFLALSATGLLALGASLSPQYKPIEVKKLDAATAGSHGLSADLATVVERIDASFRQDWQSRGLRPAPRADQLTIARRLSLALAGTIPSLEEIRRLEATPEDARLNAWVSTLLADPRHHSYFAERLARAYVGVQTGKIFLYRRRRFTTWLAEQIRDQRPYDALVRELISSSGQPTSEPAINFLSVTIKPDSTIYHVDEKEMAARVSRAFLGVRIDCAECHNHPFEPWKQADFQGLAAYFRDAEQKYGGIRDMDGKFQIEDRVSGKMLTIEPRVPFQSELLPAKGSDRQRLAAWVTDPHNKRFSQAIANRIWTLMFDRGLVEPIDDIRSGQKISPALEILANDFAAHGFSLRRMITIICACEVFQLDSRNDPGKSDDEITPAQEEAWAVFPIRRLRPEQIVGAINQAASLTTLDQDSHLLLRAIAFKDENDFIRRYGDQGDDELADAGGTIPQRLLMMNGNLVNDRTKYNLIMNASSRIATLAPDDATAIETAYLATLSRRPTAPEAAHFTARLADVKQNARRQRIEDLYWDLLNSAEFSWNH